MFGFRKERNRLIGSGLERLERREVFSAGPAIVSDPSTGIDRFRLKEEPSFVNPLINDYSAQNNTLAQTLVNRAINQGLTTSLGVSLTTVTFDTPSVDISRSTPLTTPVIQGVFADTIQALLPTAIQTALNSYTPSYSPTDEPAHPLGLPPSIAFDQNPSVRTAYMTEAFVLIDFGSGYTSILGLEVFGEVAADITVSHTAPSIVPALPTSFDFTIQAFGNPLGLNTSSVGAFVNLGNTTAINLLAGFVPSVPLPAVPQDDSPLGVQLSELYDDGPINPPQTEIVPFSVFLPGPDSAATDYIFYRPGNNDCQSSCLDEAEILLFTLDYDESELRFDPNDYEAPSPPCEFDDRIATEGMSAGEAQIRAK